MGGGLPEIVDCIFTDEGQQRCDAPQKEEEEENVERKEENDEDVK